MKPNTLLLILIVAAIAATGGWYFAKHFGHSHGSATASGERQIRFYQCSMHPQVKSDKPGKCTICGMELSPIYEGDTALTENLVTLSPSIIQVINVQSAPVKKGLLERTIRVAGTIDDDDRKHRIISAYIDGRIEELFVNFNGAEVKQGEPLATFYSPNLLTAEREYLLLLERKPAGGNEEIQREHKRLIDASAQRLERLGLTREQIQKLGQDTNSIARSQIVAPMSGTVVNRMVYEGQYVKEGEPLFEIADFSTMWFKFDAYEQDLPWLKPGQKVQVSTPSLAGKTLEGEITFIDPNLNEPTRSAKIRVELDNPLIEENGRQRRLLLHRLYAEGTVRIQSGAGLLVPRTAVLNPGGQPLVYVDVGEGSYEARQVKLGLRGQNSWQVLEGIEEGENVVTHGNMLIDAQAQLNQSSQSPGEQHGQEKLPEIKADELSEINEAQIKAAEALLSAANHVGAALAADDLQAFNNVVSGISAAAETFANAFENAEGWKTLAEPIANHSMLKTASDLAAARKAFHPFSMALAEFTKHLRAREKTFATVKIYRCPMVNQAIPGAPKNGFWIQLQPPLRNPYFGADMLECGTEVKP